jgi:ubiquinol-cytochrome c reductase cytochrome b subunit
MKSHIIKSLFFTHVIFYPTPNSINYNWSFGSLAGLFFIIQVITGIFLAMHYIPGDMAFSSIDYIIREINFGNFFRYAHANGASIIFIVLYMHIAKALYFKAYLPTKEKKLLFFSGILLFLLMMGTAFIGYVLPYGQMSY